MEYCQVSREESKPHSPLQCPYCSKSFKTVSSRNSHIRRTHKKEPPDTNKSKLLCPYPNCLLFYYRSDSVRQHLCAVHKIELKVEVLSFPDNRAFFTWKGNIEEENKCYYISSGSPKHKDKLRIMWFNCLAYGSRNNCHKENQETEEDHAGRPFCPSTLKVTISEDDTFTVEYYKTHMGHKVLNDDSPILAKANIEINGEVCEVIPFNQILDDARRSVCGTAFQRVIMLTQDDCHAESAAFEQKDWGMLCGDEFNSIGVWVHQMKTLDEYSPVAFFKQKGKQHEILDTDDLMIVIMTKFQKEVSKKFLKNKICVDLIHGAKTSDFCLTSVLALEESSLVFPIAFCISSKTDEVSMGVFFETVKSNVGTFESSVFMSNDDPSLRAAWEKVMASDSSSISWLLSSWDIDSKWRENLDEIVGEEEKIITYKTLRVLLEESDTDVFQVSFESFLVELRDDVFTNRFSEYFYREYFDKVKEWAFCYRKDLGISSDVYLEAMHRTLKNYYLAGETTKRVSKSVQSLLKLTQNEILRMPSDFIDYDSNCWFYKMYESHQLSLKIHSIFQFNANNWSVQLPSTDRYSVVTKKGHCNSECQLKCTVCNACVHSFCCTCEDNLMLYNICQHMHACARHLPSVPVAGTVVNGEEMETAAEDIPSAVSSEANFNLKLKLKVINSMLDCELSEKATKQVGDTFDLLISFLVKNKQAE